MSDLKEAGGNALGCIGMVVVFSIQIAISGLIIYGLWWVGKTIVEAF